MGGDGEVIVICRDVEEIVMAGDFGVIVMVEDGWVIGKRCRDFSYVLLCRAHLTAL
jgi:hypothetical protein